MTLRTLSRWLAGAGALSVTLALCTESADAQFPPQGGPPGGGRSSRGGFSTNPDDSFNQYSGGKDSFNLNQLPPDQKMRFERTAGFLKIQIPPDGTISRDYYKASMPTPEQMRERFSQRGGGGGPPGGGAPGGAPAMSMTVVPGSAAPGGFPQSGGYPHGGFPPSDRGGRSDRGGGDRGGDRGGDQAERRIREQDKDGDGRISIAEADDKLKPNFQKMDLNQDGFIDGTEYNIAMGGGGRSDRGGPPGGGGYDPYQQGGYSGRGQEIPKIEEEKLPVVYRYGKIPKGVVPSWYSELDTNQDGQIGLYEWRNADRPTAEFLSYDLNGDGLLTADEWVRYEKLAGIVRATPPTEGASESEGASSSSSRGESKSSSKDSSKERPTKEEKRSTKDARQPGSNPFKKN